MLEEFKKFAMRGNVVDLAIGRDHRRGLRRHRQAPVRTLMPLIGPERRSRFLQLLHPAVIESDAGLWSARTIAARLGSVLTPQPPLSLVLFLVVS